MTGLYLNYSRAQAEEYVNAGFTAGNLESRTLVIERVESIDATHASLTSCETDGTIAYNAAGEVVDDDVVSIRRTASMVFVDGRWKVTDVQNVASGEVGLCAAV